MSREMASNFEIIPYLLTILPVIKNKNVKKKRQNMELPAKMEA